MYLSAESFDREIEELISRPNCPGLQIMQKPGRLSLQFALDNWITRGILSRIRANDEDEDMIILDD